MSDATHRRTPAPRPHDPGGSDDADPARQLWCLWQQGHQPRVADFLEQAGVRDPDRIVMALRVDESERCRLGQWVPAEDYLEVFPAIRDRVESTIDLIFAEFLLREERGEPFRIARALSLEACYVAYEGGSRKRRFREMMRMIEALAQEIDEPYIWAGVSLSQAVEAYATGRWKRAGEASDRAVDILRTRCTYMSVVPSSKSNTRPELLASMVSRPAPGPSMVRTVGSSSTRAPASLIVAAAVPRSKSIVFRPPLGSSACSIARAACWGCHRRPCW
jgi:hypothetical protein